MKKLTLSKETVRNLDLNSLKNIQGGGPPYTKGPCNETVNKSCDGAICESGLNCQPVSTPVNC